MQRVEWLAALRSLDGKKFVHQGRSTQGEGGVDCIGFLIASAGICGVDISQFKDITAYSRIPNRTVLLHNCELFMTRKAGYKKEYSMREQLTAGDVIVFWGINPETPQHFAVYTGFIDNEPCVIHSLQHEGVVEMPFRRTLWRTRIHSVWVPNALQD